MNESIEQTIVESQIETQYKTNNPMNKVANEDAVLYFEIEIKSIEEITNITNVKNQILLNIKDITQLIKN